MNEELNEMTPELSELEAAIGYRFRKRELLEQAVTHSSRSGEEGGEDYERLEFLGDAVLELLCSEYLFRRYDWPEGRLTRRRAEMVCEASLAYVARTFGFGRFLRMSRGELKTGGRERSSILCDVTEAIIGAVYLDAGLEEARALTERLVFSREAELPGERKKDSKTLLQEFVQQSGPELPEYRVAAESGMPHERVFTVELYFRNELISTAEGRSKKQAEQAAAEQALEILGGR